MKNTLQNVIDLERVRGILSDFCEDVGMGGGIFDRNEMHLFSAGKSDIRKTAGRIWEKYQSQCLEGAGLPEGSFIGKRTLPLLGLENGLRLAVSPVILAGDHVADVLLGPFFTGSCDQESLAPKSAESGWNLGGPLREMDSSAPIVSEEGLNKILAFLKAFTEMAVAMGEGRLEVMRAASASLESEDKFLSLSTNALDAIVMMDSEGRITFWNPSAQRMFGYSQEETQGRDLHLLLAPEKYHETYFKAFRVFQGSGTGAAVGKTLELTALKKDGSEFPIELSVSSLRIKGKWFAVGIIRDIAERKGDEEALRRSESILSSSFAALDGLLVVIDRDYRIILSNWKDHEWVPQEERNRHPQCFRVFKNFEEPCPYCPPAKTFRDGQSRKYEDVNPIDGSFKEISVSPVFDDQGNVALVIEHVRDITDRKKAETALRESEDRFRQLAEYSPFGLSIMNKDETFEYLNPKFREILGYDLRDIPGKEAWFQKAYPDRTKRERIKALWRRERLRHERDMITERVFTVRTKGGKDKIVHFRSMDTHDGRQFMTYEDITDKKMLESQLQQAQKMEAIGTLAGGIAHDFNNILTAVIGYTEIALLEVPPNTLLQKNLTNVLKAGDRAKALVKQILAFSRQSEQELKPVQIKPIVKEALKLLRASLPTTIEIRPDIRSEALIMGDPTQVHQILMNLSTNASHAMREKGGRLEVKLEDEELDAFFSAAHPDLSPGRYLKLTVQDTGRGIPPEYLDRIFDPFFTTKEKGVGTGMGLSVVHGIAKAYKGTVTVESEVGKGTIFRVYIPVIEADEAREIGTEVPLKTGTERILLVDDEEFQVDLGRQILRRLGYDVTARTSSLDAWKAFEANPYGFDLLITDMTMPNMTGVDLAGRVMAVRPEMPVILCTGYSEIITETKAKELGIREFVMKPLVIRQLAETIRRVLDADQENL